MNKLIVGLAALHLLIGAMPADARNRFELEAKPGAAFPTQDIGDASLGTGFGSEVTVAYWFIPELAVYGG